MNQTGSCYRKEVHSMNFPAEGASVSMWKQAKCACVKRAGPLQHLFLRHIPDCIFPLLKPNRMRLRYPCSVIRLQDGSMKNFMCRLFVSNLIFVRKPVDIMLNGLKRVQKIF